MQSTPSPYPVECSFFGFCPTEFVDKVVDLCDDFGQGGVVALEDKLKEEEPLTEHHGMIKAAVDQLHHGLDRVFDTNIDKFEMYSVRNIFHVPQGAYAEWARQQRAAAEQDSRDLGGAEAQALPPPSDEQQEAVDRELGEARRALRGLKRQNAHLAEQLTRQARLRRVLDADVEHIAQCLAQFEAQGLHPLDAAVERLLVQRRALETLRGQAQACVERDTMDVDPGPSAVAPAPTPRTAHREARSMVATRSPGDVSTLMARIGPAPGT